MVWNICLYCRSSEIKNSCVHQSTQEASETNQNKSLVKREQIFDANGNEIVYGEDNPEDTGEEETEENTENNPEEQEPIE